MKKYSKWHKYSSFVMMISALICICTGSKKTEKCHRKSAIVLVISTLLCIWSGHKLLEPKTQMKQEKEPQTE